MHIQTLNASGLSGRNFSNNALDVQPLGLFKPWYESNQSFPNASEFSPFDNATYSRYIRIIEVYIIPVIAGVGIITNIICIFLLNKDSSMRNTTHVMLMCMLVSDVCHLSLAITFTQLRHHWISVTASHLYYDVTYYLSLFMYLTQFISIWMLYAAAVDACRHLISFQKPQHMYRAHMSSVVIILSLIIHLPFLPQIREFMSQNPAIKHNPCSSPFLSLWDFTIDEATDTDIFYIVYFVFVYWLLAYAVPFFLIGCCCKDLLDYGQSNYLHAKRPFGWPVEATYAGITAGFMASSSAFTLFCMTPKLLLLLFKMMDFATHYLHNAHLLFQYSNGNANLMLLLRAFCLLPAVLWFSEFTRTYAKNCLCGCRSQLGKHKVPSEVVTVIKIDELSEEIV